MAKGDTKQRITFVKVTEVIPGIRGASKKANVLQPKARHHPRDVQRACVTSLSTERRETSNERETNHTLRRSLGMIPNQCIEVQTSPVDRYSVPPWFTEVVILAQHLATKNLLEAFAQQVRLVRGRFGSYESIDFLALLIGYAISGERTLADFFERLEPFESAFMALFGRRCLPHRSSLSRAPFRCGSSLCRSLSDPLRAEQRGLGLGPRNHWWDLRPARTSLHRL